MRRTLWQRLGDLLLGRYKVEDDPNIQIVNQVEQQIDERLARAKEKAWARLRRET